jgi:hypothetical protein
MTCGKKLERTVGKRPKKFCSDACRIHYRNNNRLEGYREPVRYAVRRL